MFGAKPDGAIMDDATRAEIEKIVQEAMVKHRHPLKIFGLNATKEYAQKVASHLGKTLTPHEEYDFKDGECYLRSLEGPEGNVRGHDVFVIQSLYEDETESVADKFMKLQIFCGSLRQASCHDLTVVIPHLAWARQDQKDKSRAPVITKLIASMIESVGVDKVLFLDVHNLAAESNAFNIRTTVDNLSCRCLFADWCERNGLNSAKKLVGVSPDEGGLKRTRKFADTLSKRFGRPIPVGIMDKNRISGDEIEGERLYIDVQDAEVFVIDDMISTAGTINRCCEMVSNSGGHVAAVFATHGLFAGNANENLDWLDTRIVIADSIRPWRLNAKNLAKIEIIDTSLLMASAIKRIHSGTGSISELIEC